VPLEAPRSLRDLRFRASHLVALALAGSFACAPAALGPSEDGVADEATVSPARADLPLRLASSPLTATVRVAWEGAGAALAHHHGDRTVYPDTFGPGFDLERVVMGDATEDWVRLPRPVTALRMTVSTRGVAGLRLVGSTLELLDADGAPRLRMSPPWVRDRAGHVHAVEVTVDGCAVSHDPRPPWGSPPTPPGADVCTVLLGIGLPASSFPALLDPTWGPTGNLAVRRSLHTATPLVDGRVLVAGGFDGESNQDLASAEIYDPSTGTFAATSALTTARRAHMATRLADGTVAVLGGDVGLGVPTILASVERYDPATGTWSPRGPLARERTHATTTRLSTGELLVVGGLAYATQGTSFADAELCARDASSCRPTRALPDPRADHSASLLADDRVLVAGGGQSVFNSVSSLLATSAIFDRASETWSEGPALPEPRFGHAAVTTPAGQVLLVGGALVPQGETQAIDVIAWSPGGARFLPAGSLVAPRWLHAATALPSGRVLVVGTAAPGYQLGSSTSAELFDPATRTSRSVGTVHRTSFPAQAALLDGRVLVAGGGQGSSATSAYLFADDPPDAGPHDAGLDADASAADGAPPPLDATALDAGGGTPALEDRGFYACSTPPAAPPWGPAAIPLSVALLALARRLRDDRKRRPVQFQSKNR